MLELLDSENDNRQRMVDVRIDGFSTSLIVDTGSYISVVDPNLFKGCEPQRSSSSPNSNYLCLGREIIQGQFVANDLRVRRKRATNVAFLLRDLSILNAYGGVQISGLLGMNSLSLWPFELNFADNELILHNSQDGLPQSNLRQLVLDRLGRPLVEVRSEIFELSMLIDTGSKISLVSRKTFSRMERSAAESDSRSHRYMTISGQEFVASETIKLKSLVIDKCLLTDVTLVVAAADDLQSGDKLGIDVLENCHLAIDIRAKQYSASNN